MEANDPTWCPICGPGVRMYVNKTRRSGPHHKRRYRSCDTCGRRDTMLVRLEQIVGIRVLDCQTGDSDEADPALH